MWLEGFDIWVYVWNRGRWGEDRGRVVGIHTDYFLMSDYLEGKTIDVEYQACHLETKWKVSSYVQDSPGACHLPKTKKKN